MKLHIPAVALFITGTLSQFISADSPPAGPEFILKDSIWRMQGAAAKPDYRNFIESQGYTAVNMEVLDRAGNFYFYSPVLAKKRWTQNADLLTPLLKDFSEGNQKQNGKNVKVHMDLSAMSGEPPDRGPRQLDAKETSGVALDLYDYYNFSDITIEPVSPESQSILYWSVNTINRKLNVMVTPSLYGDFPIPSISNRDRFIKDLDRYITQDLYPYPLKNSRGAFLPTMGLGDVVFGIARTKGKEVWAGCGSGAGFPEGSEHNLLLYRAAQYSPEGFMVLPTGNNDYIYDAEKFNFDRDIKKDILDMLQTARTSPSSKKPVANLVLSSQEQRFSTLLLPHFVEPITNAILANGYELKVTFGELYKGAELYYVTNSDEWPKDIRFFEELLSLFDHRKSRFYGRVILHPTGEIIKSGLWKRVREIFKIPETEEGWIEDLPVSVRAFGQDILWKGSVPFNYYGTTHIREEQVRSNSGEIVLSKILNNETIALIVKSGNHYLVNGNSLHLEAAFFLSALMGGAIRTPFAGYVTSSSRHTAALAIAETTLKIKIPSLEVSDKWRVILYDKNGRVVRNELSKAKEIFEIKMKPYELVLLRSE